MHIPLSRLEALPTRQRRHAIHQQVLGDRNALLLKHARQPLLLALSSRRDQRLAALGANQLDLGAALGGIADRQQGDGVGLAHDREARVVAARVALPVGIVGDVARGHGHGVVVEGRVVAAGGRPAEVRVEGHAVGAFGVDGEGTADAFPDAGGLEGVFLGAELRRRRQSEDDDDDDSDDNNRG